MYFQVGKHEDFTWIMNNSFEVEDELSAQMEDTNIKIILS